MLSLTPRKKRLIQEALVVFLLALAVRIVPAILNWGWGNDFGIYYGITQALINNPHLFQPYDGWGKSYNYFPMLYIIISAAHLLTGIAVPTLMRFLSPMLGSLSVVFFYLFIREVVVQGESGDYIEKHPVYGYLPFLGALLLAMNPFHAYQTAHAAPLTVGHMNMMLSLWLFARKNRHDWAMQMLYPATLMLIMSHHLTTFVYIVFITGIIFFRATSSSKKYDEFNSDFLYLVILSAMAFAYWALIATPVFWAFMPHAVNMSPFMIVLLFYLALMLMYVFFNLRWKRGVSTTERVLHRDKERLLAVATAAGIMAVIVAFTVTDFGTGFVFLPIAPLLLAPTVFLLAFAVVGINRAGHFGFSYYIRGMFFSIVVLFLYSVLTWNPIIFPFRLIEYMAYPLVLYEAIGIISVVSELLHIDDEEVRAKSRTLDVRRLSSAIKSPRLNERDRRKATVAITVIVGLILVAGATTYAVQKVTSGYEEAIPREVANAIDYLEGNVTPGTTIASDHRISTLLWEAGFTPTYDSAYHLWFSTEWNDSLCLRELYGNGSDGKYYGKVHYVVIDSVMVRDGVQSNINETPRPILPESYEKFNKQPFELVYENLSSEPLMSEEKWEEAKESGEYLDKYPYIGAISVDLPNAKEWCRVYRVNWTYIDLHLNESGNVSSGAGGTRAAPLKDTQGYLPSSHIYVCIRDFSYDVTPVYQKSFISEKWWGCGDKHEFLWQPLFLVWQ